jgi:hypothetical protein
MKTFVLLLCFSISMSALQAQRIKVNGDVATLGKVAVEGVLVMAFDSNILLMKYVTDQKGQYSFYVDTVVVFDLLFYKPGHPAYASKVRNLLQRETQAVYISIEMDDSASTGSVDLNVWLPRHHLAALNMDSLYAKATGKYAAYKRKIKKDKRQLVRNALAEQKRFSNYKETKSKRSIGNQQSDVTTVTIGPDTYEMITNDKGAKQYYKNQKPITEITYRFETTRRYDGVLKDSKNVKKFDKYKPLEHVKR